MGRPVRTITKITAVNLHEGAAVGLYVDTDAKEKAYIAVYNDMSATDFAESLRALANEVESGPMTKHRLGKLVNCGPLNSFRGLPNFDPAEPEQDYLNDPRR